MVQTAEVVAGAGTVLTCPKCKACIGTLRKPLFQNYSFGLDLVRFEDGQQPDAQRPAAECRKCGEPYSQMSSSITAGRRTWIHTEFGWLPPAEQDVASAVRGAIERVN